MIATLRTEDRALLTGMARYVDDLALTSGAGALRAVFVRSPHAHAWIVSIGTGAASTAPGVVAVLTAADLALGLLPSHPMLPRVLRPARARRRRRALRG